MVQRWVWGGGREDMALCSAQRPVVLKKKKMEGVGGVHYCSLGSARYCLHKKQVKTAVGIISLILHFMPQGPIT